MPSDIFNGKCGSLDVTGNLYADAGAFRRAPISVAAAAETSERGRHQGSRGNGSLLTSLETWVIPISAQAVRMFAFLFEHNCPNLRTKV